MRTSHSVCFFHAVKSVGTGSSQTWLSRLSRYTPPIVGRFIHSRREARSWGLGSCCCWSILRCKSASPATRQTPDKNFSVNDL